ncbi:hypothetical protein AWB78_02401 [Caballeronia calidae]|uniref:Uncharacterized protein n=2 Tax=Caballeronia calidae TaxID=1777139 RepID=A0A158B8H6_9BURK|nr:hypothetical protein AWB78_02401 [Caballeronia calidae]
MQRHALRPVTVIRGQKFVKRQKAATYRRKMKRRQHAALGRMIAASDHAGLYDIEAYPKTLSIVDMAGSLKPQKRVDIEDMNPWKS